MRFTHKGALVRHQDTCRGYFLARSVISKDPISDAKVKNFKTPIKYLDPRAQNSLDLDISTLNTHKMATEAVEDTINNN